MSQITEQQQAGHDQAVAAYVQRGYREQECAVAAYAQCAYPFFSTFVGYPPMGGDPDDRDRVLIHHYCSCPAGHEDILIRPRVVAAHKCRCGLASDVGRVIR